MTIRDIRRAITALAVSVWRQVIARHWHERPIGMKSRFLVVFVLVSGCVSLPLDAASAKPDKEDVVKLDPYVVETRSLANAGFRFKAKFRPHFIGEGIKELIIVEVGPQSQAKKAGLAVGERILQIRDVKVEGLGLEELQNEFRTQSADGKVPLLVQAKGSSETRTVVLQFPDTRKKASN